MRKAVSSLCLFCFHYISTVDGEVSVSIETSSDNIPSNTTEWRDYYFATTSMDEEIGFENPYACAGNPLKGLIANPSNNNYDPSATSIDPSMDFHFLGLDSIMMGNPAVVGVDAAFNWTALESVLDESSSRNRHVVLSFLVHYPGRPLMVPEYLMKSITLHHYDGFLGGGLSPDYSDPILLRAMEQFVTALGANYDGDHRIGFINTGLLGFWGEFHTFPHNFVPEFAKHNVIEWFHAAFSKTHILTRYPFDPAYQAGFGYSDGSFAYHTLDGDANGGVDQSHYYFWPLVESAGHTDFWKRAPMAGETRPEIQPIVFEPWYPAGSFERQDFIRCIYTTHASFMLHQDAFINGGYSGEKLERANHAHTRLGYNFVVAKVAAFESSSDNGLIDLDVTIKQVGVAPFYYPLSLVVNCSSLNAPISVDGVESIIEEGDIYEFTLKGIPATQKCLDRVSVSLDSPHAYKGRPIKFAQGLDGEVNLSLPVPPRRTNIENNTSTELIIDHDKSYVMTSSSPSINMTSTEEPTFSPSFSPSTTNSLMQSTYTPLSEAPLKIHKIYSLSLLVKLNTSTKWLFAQPLNDGDIVNIHHTGSSLSVRADTEGLIDRIMFTINGRIAYETIPPYTLGGKTSNGVYKEVPELTEPGIKLISVAVLNGNGTVLENRQLTLFVIHRGTTSKSDNQLSSDIAQNKSGIIDNVHGFNTPEAPSLLDLVDEIAGKGSLPSSNEKKQNKLFVWIMLLVCSVAMLSALVMSRYFRYEKTTATTTDDSREVSKATNFQV